MRMLCGAHGEREVVGERDDLPHLHAGGGLVLELGDGRPDGPPGDAPVDLEGAQHLLESLGGRVELAPVDVRVPWRSFRQELLRRPLGHRLGRRIRRLHLGREAGDGRRVAVRLDVGLAPARPTRLRVVDDRLHRCTRRQRARGVHGVERRHLLRCGLQRDREVVRHERRGGPCATPARHVAGNDVLARRERERRRRRIRAPCEQGAHRVPGERAHGQRAEREGDHQPRAERTEALRQVVRGEMSPQPRGARLLALRAQHQRGDGGRDQRRSRRGRAASCGRRARSGVRSDGARAPWARTARRRRPPIRPETAAASRRARRSRRTVCARPRRCVPRPRRSTRRRGARRQEDREREPRQRSDLASLRGAAECARLALRVGRRGSGRAARAHGRGGDLQDLRPVRSRVDAGLHAHGPASTVELRGCIRATGATAPVRGPAL